VKNFVKGLGIGLILAALYVGALVFAPDGAWEWIIPLGPLSLIAAFLGFRLPEDNLKRWSKSHGVPITPDNRDVIVRHLTRGRRIRTAGAVLGAYGYLAVTVQVGRDEVSWGIWRSIFFGYLIGAGLAEMWALRLRVQGPRAASLAPRSIHDYLPRPATYIMRFAVLGTVALAVAWQWIPTGRERVGVPRPGVGWIAMWAGLSVVVTIFAELVVRSIVRRPQPAVSEELLRVDDAIRSSSMHQLAGAALALVLGILSARLADLGYGHGGLVSGLQALGGLCGLASVVAWLHLGVDQAWVVRRSSPVQQEAAA
jgi:hypothetical protein